MQHAFMYFFTGSAFAEFYFSAVLNDLTQPGAIRRRVDEIHATSILKLLCFTCSAQFDKAFSPFIARFGRLWQLFFPSVLFACQAGEQTVSLPSSSLTQLLSFFCAHTS